eukprot:7160340-Prymnesium_polylepis.1
MGAPLRLRGYEVCCRSTSGAGSSRDKTQRGPSRPHPQLCQASVPHPDATRETRRGRTPCRECTPAAAPSVPYCLPTVGVRRCGRVGVN